MNANNLPFVYVGLPSTVVSTQRIAELLLQGIAGGSDYRLCPFTDATANSMHATITRNGTPYCELLAERATPDTSPSSESLHPDLFIHLYSIEKGDCLLPDLDYLSPTFAA